MEEMNRPYELIFINDGSRDKSLSILYALFQKHGRILRIITSTETSGSHMAIMGGFEKARRIHHHDRRRPANPPEEIRGSW
jgi:undecaprenyl-phosphate 4-deoxy-4-formamido-L-arabinose transferase